MDGRTLEKVLFIYEKNSPTNWALTCEEKIKEDANRKANHHDISKHILNLKIDCKNEKRLYLDTLYNVRHRIGKDMGPGGTVPYSNDKLYEYCQRAFRVDPETHEELLAKTETQKPPTIILNVGLIEAKNLEAKDTNGFSDPYCMLGVIPGNVENIEKARKLSATSLNQAMPSSDGMSTSPIPVNFLHVSNVKYKTLNPVWNEHFKCVVQDIESEKFHLDIWDHDDDTSVFDAAKKLNNIQGMKGVNRYFKQIVQSARCNENNQNIDDFLGCVTIDLKSLTSTVTEKWYELKGRSSKSKVQGDVKLKLYLSTTEEGEHTNDLIEINVKEVDQQIELNKIFITYALSILPSYIRVEDWDGDLPSEANYILHQHAVQGDVNEVQQVICKWIALANLFTENEIPFNYNVFTRVLQNLDYLTSNETYEMSLEEINMLSESFTAFTTHLFDTFGLSIEEFYPLPQKTSIFKLENNLNLIGNLYSMKVFQKCCPFINELPTEMRILLKKSIQQKYENIRDKLEDKLEDDGTVTYLVKLAEMINYDLFKYHNYYLQPFKATIDFNVLHVVGRLYSQLYVQDVSKLMNGTEKEDCRYKAQDVLKELEQNKSVVGQMARRKTLTILDNDHFQLYCQIRNMCDCAEFKCKIFMIYWFILFYDKWLDSCQIQIIKNLKLSMEREEVSDASKDIPPERCDAGQDSSANSSGACLILYLNSLLKIWDQTDVLKQELTYYFVKKHYEIITQSVIFYTDLVLIKANEISIVSNEEPEISDLDGINDKALNLTAIPPLTLAINDIGVLREHIKKYTSDFRESLSDEYLKEFTNVVNSMGIEKSLENKKLAIIENLSQYIYETFMVNKAKQERLTDEQVTQEFLLYLNHCFCDLKQGLNGDDFFKCIQLIYDKLIEDYSATFQKLPNKRYAKQIYENIKMILGFFHADGQGISMENLETDKYKGLANKLVWHQMDTKDLIDLALILKLEKQMSTPDSKYGLLTLKVYFDDTEDMMHIYVMNAQNLLAMDPGGSSDPFIEIQLLPKYIFGRGAKKRTKTIKKTLNPVFNEDLNLPFRSNFFSHISAMIRFTALDQDIMGIDYIGEAYLSLRDIPRITKTEDKVSENRYDQIMPTHLQFIKIFSTSRSGPEMVLEERSKWDEKAKEYFN